MPPEDFHLTEERGEKTVIQLSGSERITPCGKKVEEGLKELSQIPQEVEDVDMYTGRENIHPEFEKILEKIETPSLDLHLPFTALKESEELIENHRTRLNLTFHIDREVKTSEREELKTTFEELERSDQISIIYHLQTEEDLLIKQISARLPKSQYSFLIEDNSEENLEKALKLADELLTISRIRELGIGWNIPEFKKPRELEKKLFDNRNKQIRWLTCKMSDIEYLQPGFKKGE